MIGTHLILPVFYRRMQNARATLLSFASLGLIACGGGFKPENYPDPVNLFDVSELMYREGDCGDAIEGFRQVTFSVPPRDSTALRARFMMAECHLRQSEFLEAARQFQRIADEAPASRLAPNALLRAGDAYARLWKAPQLDPTYGESAMNTYREVTTRFPGTTAARRAGFRTLELNEWFARKEFDNGDLYLRWKAYDSAILYYKNVVALYGQTSYAPRALLRLVQIYERLEYETERADMCQHLRDFYADVEGVESRCPTEAP